ALSAVLIPDPPALATPSLLRLLARSGKPFDLLYAGDRMWPTVRHGERFPALPVADRPARTGEVVVACPGGIPDLLRVVRADAGAFTLRGDADPHESFNVPAEAVLARASLGERGATGAARTLRRVLLDLREAARGRPDPRPDPALTVQAKYDAQAPFYSAA